MFYILYTQICEKIVLRWKKIMWVRLTSVKAHPDKLDELRKIYNEEIVPRVKAEVKGVKDVFLLECIEDKGEVISFAAFESKADGDAYEASGLYKEMVGKVSHTFAESPALKSYKVKK